MIESLEDMKKEGRYGVLVEYQGKEYILELTETEAKSNRTALINTIETKIEDILATRIIEANFEMKE